MSVPFIKMHGAQNDYVFVDGFTTPLPPNPARLAKTVSCRQAAIGSDGLVYLVPPETADADVQMQMWNADGSSGAMCGNAARCVAMWMQHQQRCGQICRIQIGRRNLAARILQPLSESQAALVSVDLGTPDFPAGQQPVRFAELQFPDGQSVTATLISLGNPHAVVFTDDLSDVVVSTLGPALETHDYFPDRTNVEFVKVLPSGELQVRVWERGSGETKACGSGACAAAAVWMLRRQLNTCTDISVSLPGGTLSVAWDRNSAVQLTGPAELSFTGVMGESLLRA